MDVVSPPGVFTPISDSWQLAAAVRREPIGPGSRSLDLCTGTGVVALAAAECGADATAVDVSRRAVWTTRWNAARNGLAVRAVRGRLFEPVAGERFDLITGNPPYVPSTEDDVPNRGLERAWAAGRDGRLVLDEICDRARAHLRPGGALLLVHSDLIGEDATLQRLADARLEAPTVIARYPGPLGPLMRAQQAAGTIPADVDEEDVLVIRASAPG